jgi:general secretion pathway protein C
MSAPSNAPASPAEALGVIESAFRFEFEDDGELALYPGQAPALFRAAGFQPGDVITAVDGTPAPQDGADLVALMADLPPGRPFTVTIERGGNALDVPIDLSRLPQ